MKKLILFVLSLASLAFSQTTQTPQVAAHIIYGTSTPALCKPTSGDVFFVTTGGGLGPYYCSATNTWTAMAGGGGGGTPGGSVTAVQFNNPAGTFDGDTTKFQYMPSIATPAAPVIGNVGATGAVTDGYELQLCTPTGCSALSPEGTTTTANATLSGSNYNTVALPSCASTPNGTWSVWLDATHHGAYTAGRIIGATGLACGSTYNHQGAQGDGAATTSQTTDVSNGQYLSHRVAIGPVYPFILNNGTEYSGAASVTFPVPTFQPTQPGKNITFDMMPSGTTTDLAASDGAGHSRVAADWCADDLRITNWAAYRCLHFDMFATGANTGYGNIGFAQAGANLTDKIPLTVFATGLLGFSAGNNGSGVPYPMLTMDAPASTVDFVKVHMGHDNINPMYISSGASGANRGVFLSTAYPLAWGPSTDASANQFYPDVALTRNSAGTLEIDVGTNAPGNAVGFGFFRDLKLRTVNNGGWGAGIGAASCSHPSDLLVINGYYNSVTNPFVAGDVGGWLDIISGTGWTVGRWVILTYSATGAGGAPGVTLEWTGYGSTSNPGVGVINRDRILNIHGVVGSTADNLSICALNSSGVPTWTALY